MLVIIFNCGDRRPYGLFLGNIKKRTEYPLRQLCALNSLQISALIVGIFLCVFIIAYIEMLVNIKNEAKSALFFCFVRLCETVRDLLKLFSAVKYTRTDRLEVKITSLFPKIQRKSKSGQASEALLVCLCREGLLDTMVEEYVYFCKHPSDCESGASEAGKKSAKGRFPNLAGFCRFMKIGIGELDELEKKFPKEHDRILSVFEDEALNSDLSSALLSSYMKKRLLYESSGKSENSQIKVCFEHDIFGDGE